MLNLFLCILTVFMLSIATYFTSKVLIKHIYYYAKNFYKKPLTFVLFYSGLVVTLVPAISAINLVFLNNAILGYYILLYNVVLDSSIVLGTFILLSKNKKIRISRDIIFALSLAFTVHLILILKKSLNFIDSIILFITFIIISIFLTSREKASMPNIKILKSRQSTYKKNLLIYFPIIFFSLIIFYLSGILISFVSLQINNILKNPSLVGYIINLISNVSPNLIFALVILQTRESLEEGILPTIGEYIYTFTILSGILCGISTIRFTIESLLPVVSSFFLIYTSMLFLNILAYGYKIPSEVGIFLIILGIIIGVLTMV